MRKYFCHLVSMGFTFYVLGCASPQPVSLAQYEPHGDDLAYRIVQINGKEFAVGTRIPTGFEGAGRACKMIDMRVPNVPEMQMVFDAGEFRASHYRAPNSILWTSREPPDGYFLVFSLNGNLLRTEQRNAAGYFACVRP